MGEYIIKVNNAFKKFKETTALNNVSIDFEKGKIHGIIGRNGSGKTVLFKCICGFMSLTSGEITVREKKVNLNKMLDNVGIIINEPGFLPSMSGFKNLKLLAMVHRKINDEQIRNTIKMVGLDPASKKHVGKYSMGMRQRLGIAQAIMEQPDILILDEPMNGLDKHGVEDMRNLFLKLKNDGVTILLASHNSEDIKLLCDTVCEMDGGILTQLKTV
ncbi:MAG: ATP-binding cassette domain-containing protein [Bacteroidales bacterium]|nr:ATP-binding cassette domain-containing protein [Bacteroidales bacterium]